MASVPRSVVRVTYAVRDHERNIKRSVTKTFPLIPDHETTYATSHDSSEIKSFATSPSKSRQAILREVANGSSTKRFVEVWTGTQIEASLDVTKYHDVFLTDGEPIIIMIVDEYLLTYPRFPIVTLLLSLRDISHIHCRSECQHRR